MMQVPSTVVEVAPFSVHARKLWSDTELGEFVDFIARNPLAGTILTAYGKNVADDLSADQRQALTKAVTVLLEQYRRA